MTTEWTQKRFPLRVRVKRSVQPLSFGFAYKGRGALIPTAVGFGLLRKARRCHSYGRATGHGDLRSIPRRSVLEYLSGSLRGLRNGRRSWRRVPPTTHSALAWRHWRAARPPRSSVWRSTLRVAVVTPGPSQTNSRFSPRIRRWTAWSSRCSENRTASRRFPLGGTCGFGVGSSFPDLLVRIGHANSLSTKTSVRGRSLLAEGHSKRTAIVSTKWRSRKAMVIWSQSSGRKSILSPCLF